MCLDVGTCNESLLADERYSGLRHTRLRGAEYSGLVDEFVGALRAWRPHCVLQWEDFANHTAFELLQRQESGAVPRSCSSWRAALGGSHIL